MGESFGDEVTLRLAVELIPQTAWGQSIKKRYPELWLRIRRAALDRALGRCEVCGRPAEGRSPLEVHERWEWRTRTKEQRLKGLIALCVDCHATIHWGRTQNVAPSSLDRLRAHWATVNGVSIDQFEPCADEAWDLFHERSEIEWRLVLDVLE